MAILKLNNRYYKILWIKSTGTFKEQTRTPLKQTIEKILITSKNNIQAILADFSPCRYENAKTRNIFFKKTPKAVYSWSNQSWNPIANFRKLSYYAIVPGIAMMSKKLKVAQKKQSETPLHRKHKNNEFLQLITRYWKNYG